MQTNNPKVEPRVMKILLAYDGSESALAAVSLLRDLPLAQESQVTALAVMPTQWITGHEQLQQSLDSAVKALQERFMHVEGQLRAGTPAASINELATELRADLIVMGAKGLRATLGILLGGVAQQVVEYSRCPVLVVRATRGGLRRVLISTDGSSHSQRAVEYLCGAGCAHPQVMPGGEIWAPCGIPLPADTQITVMHVLSPSVSPEMAMRAWTVGPEALYPAAIPQAELEALQKAEEERGQELLKSTVNTMRKAGISANSALRHGDAATEILEYIKTNQVDMVVSGSRGLSQVAGWLLGSVSRKLVHYAPCSVLIVK